MEILVGFEESQAVTIQLRKAGHEAYSCDLKPCSGGHPEWHLQMDVFAAIKSRKWDAALFFPTCTYLTISAEWAYKEPPYHQKIKVGTLTGKKRWDNQTDGGQNRLPPSKNRAELRSKTYAGIAKAMAKQWFK